VSDDILFVLKKREHREIDWSTAYPGIEVRRPKFGIVLHGVPIETIDPRHDNMGEHARHIESENKATNLKIARLRTLKAP
jgi:hypothetical protein